MQAEPASEPTVGGPKVGQAGIGGGGGGRRGGARPGHQPCEGQRVPGGPALRGKVKVQKGLPLLHAVGPKGRVQPAGVGLKALPGRGAEPLVGPARVVREAEPTRMSIDGHEAVAERSGERAEGRVTPHRQRPGPLHAVHVAQCRERVGRVGGFDRRGMAIRPADRRGVPEVRDRMRGRWGGDRAAEGPPQDGSADSDEDPRQPKVEASRHELGGWDVETSSGPYGRVSSSHCTKASRDFALRHWSGVSQPFRPTATPHFT
jgi:hypothetical protein